VLFKRLFKNIIGSCLLFSILISTSNLEKDDVCKYEKIRMDESINLIVKQMFNDYEIMSNDVTNELTIDDKEIYSEYITFSNGKAILSKDFIEASNSEYVQCDNQEYLDNLTDDEKEMIIKSKFLEDNINLMNLMVDEGYGYIDENGEFIVYEDDTYNEQETWVYDYSWSIWTNIKFKTNSKLGAIFGIAGLISNCITIFKDVRDLVSSYKINKSIFKGKLSDAFNNNAAVKNAVFDVCNEVVGNITFNESTNIFISTIMSIMSIFVVIIQPTGLVGLVVNIVLTILSIYLPGLITSLDLLIKGTMNNTGANVNIGWWWSNYTLL